MTREDDDYWKQQVVDARRAQLDAVRKAATSWAALFTAVLGVFSSVTFVSGLPGLDELEEPLAELVRYGILVAAFLTLAATVLTGMAANTLPRVTDDLTFQTFRDNTKVRARAALTKLRVALWAAALAAIVVTAGSVAVLFSTKDESADKTAEFIVVVGGRAVCGPLAVGPNGRIAIGNVPIDRAVDSLVAVSTCP